MVVGYLGESGTPGVWRMYMDRNLRSYVDIKEEDIIHARQLDLEQYPDGGTTLYVKAQPIPTIHDFMKGYMAGFTAGQSKPPGNEIAFLGAGPPYTYYCQALSVPTYCLVTS